MDKNQLKRLKTEAHNLQPTVRIGKSGITTSVIEEIEVQIKRKKLIKIKILGCDRHEVKAIAEEISTRTNAEIVDVRGNVIVLWRKRAK